MDKSVFVPIQTAYVMAEESTVKAEQPLVVRRDQISAVLVKVEPDTFVDLVASRIKRQVQGTSVITSLQLVKSVENHLSGLMQNLFFVTGMFWATSTLLIATIFSMATNERRREIGLLRAIGANGRFVFKMIVTEAILITFLGGLLGIAGGGVAMFSFSRLISTSVNIPYLWPTIFQISRVIGVSVAIAIFTGLIASFVPAVVSSKMEPLYAIRSGE